MKPLLTVAAVLMLTFGVAACSSGDDNASDTTATTTISSASTASDGTLGGAAVTPASTEGAAAASETPATAETPATEGTPAGEETPVVASTGDGVAAPANPGDLFAARDLENTLYMELKCGRVVIEMRPDLAPQTVAQIKTLTRAGFYDGLTFHRVIEGFMAQGGDPTGTGTGHSDLPNLPPEFSNTPFDRGAVGMARGPAPNSGNSQFFIMFARWASLDGQYTLWGQVTEGMDCVDQINRGEPPTTPDVILSLRVAADVE